MLQGLILSGIRLLYHKIKSLITGQPVPWSKELPHNQPTTAAEQAAKFPGSIIPNDVYVFGSKLVINDDRMPMKDIAEIVQLGREGKKHIVLRVKFNDGKEFIFPATDKVYSRLNMNVGISKI